jgi:hypothetical protein
MTVIIDPVYVHPAKKIVNVKCWSFLRGSKRLSLKEALLGC